MLNYLDNPILSRHTPMKTSLSLTAALIVSSAFATAQDSSIPPSEDFSPSWDWNNNADLTFWAPGMGDSPVQMNQIQGGGNGAQYVGNYAFYVIKGISGRLTLGNRNQVDSYWRPATAYQSKWDGASWATFGFEINHRKYKDPALYLSVSGDQAGTSTGAVTKFLDTPIVITSRGNWDTSITFVPHGNAHFLPKGDGTSNKTPSGQLVVLADIYTEPPVPTGELEASKNIVFNGESVTISYEYDQGELALLQSSYSAGGSAPLIIDGDSSN